jgi:hypothetical protein
MNLFHGPFWEDGILPDAEIESLLSVPTDASAPESSISEIESFLDAPIDPSTPASSVFEMEFLPSVPGSPSTPASSVSSGSGRMYNCSEAGCEYSSHNKNHVVYGILP